MLTFWRRLRPRVQFSLRTLLVIIACVACFFGGMSLQKRLDKPNIERPPKMLPTGIYLEVLTLPDGRRYQRGISSETPEGE